MPRIVQTATSDQTKPLASEAVSGFGGTIYIQASGTGTGTWSGVLNVAPVSSVVGMARQFSVSNTAPVVDKDIRVVRRPRNVIVGFSAT